MTNPVHAEWEQHPFQLQAGGDLGLLRRALEAAGYGESAIQGLMLQEASGKPLDLCSALRRTARETSLHTLVRLFVLAQAVPEHLARAALATAELEDLAALGLLRCGPEGVRSQAALMPADDLLLVREFWPDFTGLPLTRDYVPGMGEASRMVACLTVRRRGELAMDLGTGTGYLALVAARHARQVIATDTNPRALGFAALNARLNEVANLDLRLGSLFEPVADCRFDLIMANPPFVISPESSYEYRDSGLEGDALCERILRQVPGMLREEGFCTVLFNWHHQNEDDWAQRPAGWIASSGCDAWLTCFSTTDPLGYAGTWLHEQHEHEPEVYARLLDQWVTYLEGLRINMVSFGAIVLRRRSRGPNWFRAEIAPQGRPTQPCSDQIQRIFAAEDLLREPGAADKFLQRRFLLTPDHQLEQVLHAKENRWAVAAARLKQTRGYPFVGNVDRLVSSILAGCDGRHTLGELVGSLAHDLGADPTELAPGCCNVMATLLRWGFLTDVGRDETLSPGSSMPSCPW